MVNLINILILILVFAHIGLSGGALPQIWNPEAQHFSIWLMRAFAHGGLLHLISNLWGLWKVGSLTEDFSIPGLLSLIIFLWIASTIMLYIWNVLFLNNQKIVIGFSGVLFGLLVVFYYLQNRDIGETLWTLAPSIIPHLFMPQISFWGHLFGILSGLLYVKLFQ
jgi:rhomboid domain-containing protein 1